MTFHDREAFRVDGFVALFALVALWLADLYAIVHIAVAAGDASRPPIVFWVAVVALVVLSVGFAGLFAVQPNQARVVLFAGRYVGTVLSSGFYWTNPLTVRRVVSLRVRNFASAHLKVNDSHGNPIEIAAVVVWKVTDAARALFEVDAFEAFVALQAETALRALATRFPYDGEAHSLRGSPSEVGEHLAHELRERLSVAGVAVIEARISHLAYAPEIAQAMLRRQQAQAIIAARKQIVDGAVGMVEMALHRLSETGLVNLDDERKAQMVNNLLVVLVGEGEAQPVVNAGSLY